MLKSKTVERICCAVIVLAVIASVLMWGKVEYDKESGTRSVIGYENTLFDTGKVHTIEITMDGWDEFIADATSEQYVNCDVVVDGEKFTDVAIRAKGNTSLSSVAILGSTRYSFKLEFDHGHKGRTYHGLDKLSLNNLIQDATMMKDYLAYTMMNRMGVPAPLCSYVSIYVNGEPWGLYLAVEGVEDSFMDRNSMTNGELYKPDSMSFGGGRGNGGGFDMDIFRVNENTGDADGDASAGGNPPAAVSGGGDDFSASSGAPAQGGDFGESSGAPAQGGDFGASSGAPAQGGDFSESSGAPAQGGDFSASSGAPAQGGDAGTDFGGFSGPPSGRGEIPNMPEGFEGGFGGFNFGMGNDDVKLVYSDDSPESYSNIFNNAKTKSSKADQARLIESLRKLNAKEDLDSIVDRDEIIRYLAVHNFICNDDSYTGMMVHNYYLYEENGKLSIIPWDYNLGFGGFTAAADATSTVNSPIDSPVSGGTTDSRPLIAWIFSDEEMLAKYHTVYGEFIESITKDNWLDNEIARVQEMISPYLETDTSKFFTMDEFQTAVKTLRDFCARRTESVRGQLDGTIPSTSSGQQNSDALVDASDISTAAMGSMNGTGGSMDQPGGGPGEMPDMNNIPDMDNMLDMSNMPDTGNFPGSGFPGGGIAGQTGMPEEAKTTDPESEKTETETAPERSGNPPGGFDRGDSPGGSQGNMFLPENQQKDHTEQWIQLAILGTVLIAAILVIRRVRPHNQ